MLDMQIRESLVRDLRETHPDESTDRIWSEMAISLGASRVDICLVNGALTGFEIKSPRDNFMRLAGQVQHYSLVLDFAHLVVSARDVSRAIEHTPEWWGIMCATEVADGVALERVREAGRNPGVDPFSVAQLLWRDEARDELASRGMVKGLSKATRWTLWDLLVESLALTELQSVVRERLKKRPLRSTDLPYMQGGGR